MFVKSDTFNVVPRGGLMAEEALIYLGLLHVRDTHRNHFEMHHIMTRRSLMTLRTGLRAGRWVAEIRERPLGGGVALRTVIAEKAAVPVLGGMAGRAVE